MNGKYLYVTGLVAIVVAGAIIRCNMETASGPTPYYVYQDSTQSASSMTVGKGLKTFTLPTSQVINGIGRVVTVSPAGNSTVYMKGTITAYDRSSGSMTVNVIDTSGTGSYSNWRVVLGKNASEILDSVKNAYVALKFGMFFHFNMSTFDRCCCGNGGPGQTSCLTVSGEWGKANTPEKEFNPTHLNCGQWADAAKWAGCNYMVLVTKHHDGFCLWPTKFTKHCVSNAACTTDVVRQFCDSARSRGMRIGFYYSIRDLTNGTSLGFIKGQLTELLTNYDKNIICIWFDGWGWDAGYKMVPYDTIRDCIKRCQPNCLIVENNHEFTTTHSEMLEWEMPIDGPPPLNNTRPGEGNEPIRYSSASKERCWFWHPEYNCDLMTKETIVNHLKSNNTGHAAYLLDLTPDTTGLIPDCQVQMMKDVGGLLGVGTSSSYTGR